MSLTFKQALQQVPLDQMPTTVLDTITGSMEELDNYIRDMNLPLSKSSSRWCSSNTVRREESPTFDVNMKELVNESLAIAGGR